MPHAGCFPVNKIWQALVVWSGLSFVLPGHALTVLMVSNPLKRVIFRNKSFDCFRFAIGPQNIDTPARPGIFPRHKSWSLLGHPSNMRLWPHHSSQRSCHNQLTHYPRAYWSRNSRMSHDQLFEGCDPFHTARSLSGLPLLDVRIRSRDGPND
jgi:hypothetical protein